MGVDSSRFTRMSMAASGKARQKYLTLTPSDTAAITTTMAMVL